MDYTVFDNVIKILITIVYTMYLKLWNSLLLKWKDANNIKIYSNLRFFFGFQSFLLFLLPSLGRFHLNSSLFLFLRLKSTRFEMSRYEMASQFIYHKMDQMKPHGYIKTSQSEKESEREYWTVRSNEKNKITKWYRHKTHCANAWNYW